MKNQLTSGHGKGLAEMRCTNANTDNTETIVFVFISIRSRRRLK